MKKYQKQSRMTVDAEYREEQGNPFFEALPEILGKEEVMKRLRSQIPYPKDIQKMSPEERRREVMEISKWFYPMDYMYTIYDMLYRAMSATYQTKNIVAHIRQMNDLYMDFRTGREGVPVCDPGIHRSCLRCPGNWKDIDGPEMSFSDATSHCPQELWWETHVYQADQLSVRGVPV